MEMINAIGRRKTSVARVYLTEGTGKITINKVELEKYQRAKISNVSMYIDVQDRWMETIDSTFKTIFTEDQWKAYLKSGAEKQQKARAKRKAKAEKALEK